MRPASGLLSRLAAIRQRAVRAGERLGQAGAPRPEGKLIWLHASEAAQESALADLARRLGEAFAGASFLITSAAPFARSGALPLRSLHQLVPEDTRWPTRAFLRHWRPDLCLWAGTALRPTLIQAAASSGMPLCLIDASEAPEPGGGWRRLTGLTASTLRSFAQVLATDEGAARALIRAGARAAAVEVAGPLEEEAATLPCNMRERDSIGAVLRARPVWLAVAVNEAEEEAVIAAHRTAARLAHRLLLILVPAEAARGAQLARKAAEAGLSVAARSREAEPEAQCEVFVADSEGELGLWYRLAPVCFMGSTLAPNAGGGRSPLEPAALGSAILHGPETGPHAGLYARFQAAGAARGVADGVALAEALSDLLSPDKAAAMAHAAWRISTGGADMNQRVLALVAAALGEGAVA